MEILHGLPQYAVSLDAINKLNIGEWVFLVILPDTWFQKPDTWFLSLSGTSELDIQVIQVRLMLPTLHRSYWLWRTHYASSNSDRRHGSSGQYPVGCQFKLWHSVFSAGNNGIAAHGAFYNCFSLFSVILVVLLSILLFIQCPLIKVFYSLNHSVGYCVLS